jgi:hypothetical protein
MYYGRIVEDRGPIGKGGRHLYVVQYELGKGNWQSTVLPVDDIKTVEYKRLNQRRKREVEYIIPVECVEAYSLFAKPEHAHPLADFLRSQEVRFSEATDAIDGETNILVDKKCASWDEFVAILNEWKRLYAQDAVEPNAALGSAGD